MFDYVFMWKKLRLTQSRTGQVRLFRVEFFFSQDNETIHTENEHVNAEVSNALHQ